MAKITFFELDAFGLGGKQAYIREHLKGHEVSFVEEKFDEKNAEKAKDADAVAFFIYSKVNEAILKKLPNAKLVTTMSTGYDHIDLASCKKRNVIACNVPAYGENTVAEHAMALLLALSRKIVESAARTRKGSWDLAGLRGFDLKDKTIGILGTGRIGRHMAHYAEAFDMRVIAWDKFPNAELAKECGFTYVPIEQLFKESDVISVHLPETPDTHHIINVKNVRQIKKGCVLINTARGGLVETEALLVGMKEGIFSALGLDVLEEEGVIKEEMQLLHETFKKDVDTKTLLEEHWIIGMDNVIVTPHNAFNSAEALMRILDTTIDNIQSFFGGVPKNKLN